MQMDNTDTASLHFESILENDINQVGDTNSNDSSTGHEFLFELQRENYDVPRVNNDSIPGASYENTEHRSTFFERLNREKLEYQPKNLNHSQPKNELADNALFNKFRDAADGASHLVTDPVVVDGDRESNEDEPLDGKLKDSNSVSREDLLEFADKKPKGKERGIESDEVRIMTKVLGTIVSINRIETLAFGAQTIFLSSFFLNE